MKEGWKYVKLGDCCLKTKNIKWAETTSQHIYIDLSSVDRVTSKITDTIIVDAKNAPSRAKQIIEKGDVIFATTRPTLRRLAIIGNKFDNQICSTGFCVLRHNNKITDGWIYYQLKADRFYNYIEPLQKGANYPAVTDKVVKDYYIPLPPLSEQEEIVTYLDTSFAKIDAIKANAEKELEEAKKLFAATLNDAMTPKDGWVENTLGEIAEIKGGKRVPKGYKLSNEPTNHKYIRVADFNDSGSVDLSDIQYISDEVFEQIKRYTISYDDVYISIAGTIGKTGIIPKELDGANLTENACKLILNDCIYKYYLYYYTLTDIFKLQIKKLTMTSAQPKLALTRLSTATISFPKTSEQHSIVTHLDTISEKIRQLQSNYEKISSECDALKQAILRDTFE